MEEFAKIKLTLSSPEDIRERSYGEVKKPETINYRTLVPERDGLLCESIFGPTKDWQCSCGKYKRIRYKGIVCEKCGVEVTKSKVRRERMGHIELAVPVTHIWFHRGTPNNLAIILGVTPKDLDSVIYFGRNIVIEPGNSSFVLHQVVTEHECKIEMAKEGDISFKVAMGAEAILECLSNLDLHAIQSSLKRELDASDSMQRKKKIIKRLDVVKGFITSGNNPEWMILSVVPVIPADLRPMVQLDGGRFATSDLNDLYRRVINRNKRLKKLKDMSAPEIILRNEKRMLQEAVDALIDNSRKDSPVVTQKNRGLKSLSDMLKGKQGRFRQNLLGKRVDYSGRSVIVVGPSLKLNQCGLPKKMALELYKPFIMRELILREIASNIKAAKRLIESEHDSVWSVIEDVIKGHPVLLNRAPTLHKLGIQAFEPILIEGKAIRLHPLVCSAFNADFDGDTMSIHLVLSPESIMEARTIMMASHNIISAASGKPIISPSREMLMGCYYMTSIKDKAKGEGKYFSSKDEAILAYEVRVIAVNAAIKVRIDGELIDTTVGRVMFNEMLPEDMRDYSKSYVDRDFKKLISDIYKVHGNDACARIVNDIKDFGFKYGTQAGITISVSDLVIPGDKKERIALAEKKVAEVERKYKEGNIVEIERKREIIDIWNSTVAGITSQIVKESDPFNPVYMMSISGARGGLVQMRQLSGMRGLMADTQGRTMEIPIKSNFREGLTVLEFFMSSHGARKGSADKALRTADSGYLTRRLVDIAHDVVINEEDCGTDKGIYISNIESEGKVIEGLAERLNGRTLSEDIYFNGEMLAEKGEVIHEELAKWIESKGVTSANIRSPLTCSLSRGVCKKCYGLDLSNHKEVVLGEAVGVIAAQSIGEPGTQLTMRTFHTGGVSEKEAAEDTLRSPIKGKVSFDSLDYVENDKKEKVVTHTSKIRVGNIDIELLPGSKVVASKEVAKGDILANLSPYALHLVAEEDGYLDYSEIVIKERTDRRFDVEERIVVHSNKHGEVAQVIIRKSKKGEEIARYSIHPGSYLVLSNGKQIKKGESIAKFLTEETASRKDITGGLPKIQQLFEARSPQVKAMIVENAGIVEILEQNKKGMKVVRISGDEDKEYLISSGDRLLVQTGHEVKLGDKLTDGTFHIQDVLSVKGVTSAQEYILESVQQIYREQGVRINDKHIEIVVKQMFKKVKIVNGGDSLFLEGEIIARRKIDQENSKLLDLGKKEITFDPVVQGITKAAIGTESFISAASFQETTKVLANAAIRGKVDKLYGLKENVIIGRKIPAGTGFISYKGSTVNEK